MNVLLADDCEDTRELLSIVLESDGFGVTAVANGKDAVDAAARILPAVAILDVVMPVMTGLEAAAVMRRSWPSIRIVFHTSMEDSYVRQRFEAYDGYFRKPAAFGGLLRLLREMDAAT